MHTVAITRDDNAVFIEDFMFTYRPQLIGFNDLSDAHHFVEHYNGQDDYMEAMPNNQKVVFAVYHILPDGTTNKVSVNKPKEWHLAHILQTVICLDAGFSVSFTSTIFKCGIDTVSQARVFLGNHLHDDNVRSRTGVKLCKARRLQEELDNWLDEKTN